MRNPPGAAMSCSPFGKAKVRRVERALVPEYMGLVEHALERLGPDTRETVLALCEAPDEIRGYEQIKLAAVERYRSRTEVLLSELG